MNIEDIIQEKPHLKETLRLYERVMEFISAVSALGKGIRFEDISYPPELVDPVFEAFSSILGMPPESLSPLREALKFGRIDLSRLPMSESPVFSLPYHEDELGVILFLISIPYFRILRESHNLDNTLWEEGKCPLCNARPSLSVIDDGGRRRLHCSFCGTTGYYRRMGCPSCANEDTSQINIFTLEGEKGFRIDACDACGSYIKTVIGSLSEDRQAPDFADLISIPLDIIAQGKGYRRHSPNPIGMTRMA